MRSFPVIPATFLAASLALGQPAADAIVEGTRTSTAPEVPVREVALDLVGCTAGWGECLARWETEKERRIDAEALADELRAERDEALRTAQRPRLARDLAFASGGAAAGALIVVLSLALGGAF
jgi:hypothetical protein